MTDLLQYSQLGTEDESNVKHRCRGPNQTGKLLEMKMTSNGRRPQNWNILASTYSIVLNFETSAYVSKPKLKIALNEDDLQWKTTSTYLKWKISATTDWISFKFGTDTEGTK